MNFILFLGQFFKNRSRIWPRRKVPFRALSQLTKSGKIKYLKFIGDKLRSQIGIVSNMTNATSDIGNMVCFSITITTLKPLLLSSFTNGSEANNIEFLEVLLLVRNTEADTFLIYRLRSEIWSSDCGNHFLFSNFVNAFVRSHNPFLVYNYLFIAVLLLFARV